MIFVTGDTLATRTMEFLETSGVPYLAKPFWWKISRPRSRKPWRIRCRPPARERFALVGRVSEGGR